DEAIAMARTSQGLAADYDIVSQVIWRSACVRGLAAKSSVEEAQQLADEGVALALSVARLAAGREQEATAALLEAREAYAAKGDLVSLERVTGVRLTSSP